MKEEDRWTKEILKPLLEEKLQEVDVECFKSLLYNIGIKRYIKVDGNVKPDFYDIEIARGKGCYEADLIISKNNIKDEILPLVVIESKLKGMSSHDIITYNKKACELKKLHKNLMYGIVVAEYKKGGLTLQKLLNHNSENFDFVFCFEGLKPKPNEMNKFIEIIQQKINCSQELYNLFLSGKSLNFMYIDRQLIKG